MSINTPRANILHGIVQNITKCCIDGNSEKVRHHSCRILDGKSPMWLIHFVLTDCCTLFFLVHLCHSDFLLPVVFPYLGFPRNILCIVHFCSSLFCLHFQSIFLKNIWSYLVKLVSEREVQKWKQV